MLSGPTLVAFLRGGAIAGTASAAVNGLYFAAYRIITGIQVTATSFGSIAVSSLLPTLLGALGYFALSRFSSRATVLFVAVTTLITVGSFAGVLQDSLPGGAPKPPGFDALVMPMHVVVGAMAALLLPRLVRGPAGVRP